MKFNFSKFRRSNTGVILIRAIVSIILVGITYNPLESSFFHWVKAHPNPMDATVLLFGVILLSLHMTCWFITYKALGKIGLAVFAVILGAFTYLAFQENWVSTQNNVSLQWLGLSFGVALYTIGMSGGIIYRRLTGQVITDEAEGDHVN